MVGGGRDAFIGAVHRAAARLDGEIELASGALSSTAAKAQASGRDLGLADERNHPAWEAMLADERGRAEGDRIDFVSIVTPNHVHFPVARAFVDAGFHVVCDKPMVMTVQEARQLAELVERRGVVFCVTYNYTGYPMVKQARAMVQAGELGEVRKVIVEYNQGWLATKLEETGQKQAGWRTDPTRAGVGGAIGDIGSHAENLSTYVTGLEIESLCADLKSFLDRPVDDDANVLLRYANGARGILTASQVCVGRRNDLRLRVWGSRGGLRWHQEDPDRLVAWSIDGPQRVLHRGEAGLCGAAQSATRLPVGHPEAFIEAFGNLYRGVAGAIRGGGPEGSGPDIPNVRDGERGVRFIHAVVRSGREDRAWTPLR
ncbi:MAG: Gfo/Idh/MocA family protein [Planctomycetota bacterium]